MNAIDQELVDLFRQQIRNGLANARTVADKMASLTRAFYYVKALSDVLSEELDRARAL